MDNPASVARRTLLSWSSGKDSAWALHRLRRDPAYELVGLFSVVNAANGRAAMHAVRQELLRRQAQAAGLPLQIVEIPDPCSNAEYETRMADFLARARADGIECIAFGDLFLEDIRRYREEKLAGTGIEPVFPLWGIPTDELSRTLVEAGVRAVITCVDTAQLPAEFVGQVYDDAFLERLPEGADPCGERGEFHSFVFDTPDFAAPLAISLGETVVREGFVFMDVRPPAGV